MYKFLCGIGFHTPNKNLCFSFTDVVSGKPVYRGHCACGKQWLTDKPGHLFGFKLAVKQEGKGDE